MALMSASMVVVKGSVLRAARLRTAAPSNAEMVRSARAAAAFRSAGGGVLMV
jgi:hypothetical protein